MKYLFICALMMALSPLSRGDNRRLVEENTQELAEINRQILAQIKDLEQYKGKDIYVKVHVIDKGNGVLEAVIEKIALDKIDIAPTEKTKKIIYLKGKVAPVADDSKFKLDLEHVLPEKDDGSGNNSGSTGKTNSKPEGEQK